MNHRHIDEAGVAFGRAFVRFRQSSRAVEPAEGPLHDPSFGLDFKAAARPADHVDHPQPTNHRPRDQSRVGRIHPDDLGKADVSAQLFQNQPPAVTVLNAGRRDDQRPDEPQRVGRQMPFASVDFFFRRRSRAARPARCILSSGCRPRVPWVWASFPPVAGPWSATRRAGVPRCRPVATAESSETRSDTAANRAAAPARCSRCGSHTRWHSQSRGGSTTQAGRLAWGPGHASPTVAIERRSGPWDKRSFSCGAG